jgi:hypothetical protein
MCQAVEAHIEQYGLGPEDLLFPQWMFAYVRSAPVLLDGDESLPPLVSKTGIVHEHECPPHGNQHCRPGWLVLPAVDQVDIAIRSVCSLG